MSDDGDNCAQCNMPAYGERACPECQAADAAVVKAARALPVRVGPPVGNQGDRCSRCRWWVTGHGDLGECRRHAPQAGANPDQGAAILTSVTYPIVEANHVCGDFEQKSLEGRTPARHHITKQLVRCRGCGAQMLRMEVLVHCPECGHNEFC